MEFEPRQFFDTYYNFYHDWRRDRLEYKVKDKTALCYIELENVHDVISLVYYTADIIKDIDNFAVYFTVADNLRESDRQILATLPCNSDGYYFISRVEIWRRFSVKTIQRILHYRYDKADMHFRILI